MNFKAASRTSSLVEDQPGHVRGLSVRRRSNLVISARKVDGHWVVLSRYGDMQWELISRVTNRRMVVNFELAPAPLRDSIREVMYRYHQRGRAGSGRPAAATMCRLFSDVLPFLRHMHACNINRFCEVTSSICSIYVHLCKAHRTVKGTPLSQRSIECRLIAIEALYELSHHATDAMLAHPWPDSSAKHMAGLTGVRGRGGKTALIPDEIFSTLYQNSWKLVERAPTLLDLRDALDRIARLNSNRHARTAARAQKAHLISKGWSTGLPAFHQDLTDLRTACYIVVASLSGCRNHELALLQTGAFYSTDLEGGGTIGDDKPGRSWWMRSISSKTDEGETSWAIPEAAVQALQVMDRWAKPYQALIQREIAERRLANPQDPEIAEAQRHSKAVFLSKPDHSGKVRTLSLGAWKNALPLFARQRCGLSWNLATHQFRRTFANYAARSQFGDLRYLREHFKHWSMDMTLGYALNESHEMGLYLEIQDRLDDIKFGLADTWLKHDVPLAGGYGANIQAWRGTKAVTIFKSHRHMVRSLADSTAIRSNGHAWCTADDNGCVGNDLEPTRCGSCENAVIGLQHAKLYRGLYAHLKEVARCDDIGASGMRLVKRDMTRCRDVLLALGLNTEES